MMTMSQYLFSSAANVFILLKVQHAPDLHILFQICCYLMQMLRRVNCLFYLGSILIEITSEEAFL